MTSIALPDDAAPVPDQDEASARGSGVPAARTDKHADPSGQHEVRALQILVVDDDARNLTAIEVALEGLAAELVMARSGAEALRHLLEREFALILLDVQMPGLDGFATARLIRERARSKHIPIIFVTAHHQDDSEVLRGYELGAVDFLFKPIVQEVLQTKAQVFVELHRRTEEVRAHAERVRELELQAFEQRIEREREAWRAESLRREMEEQRRINAELAEADRQKNEFLAMLGHELRNPLAPVLLALQLMEMVGLPDPNLVKARAAAERQVRHLTRLVDDLLDVARIERGKFDLQITPHDLRDLVRQAVETADPAMKQRKHEMTFDVPDEPLYVMGDGVRLVQVVANLLHNAARYTEPGGHVRVRVTQVDDDARVVVDDDGTGIAPDFLPKVFDTFVQARRGQGLGLGLTLVQRIVQQHGGTVNAHSDGLGKGSTFTFTIPLGEPPTNKITLPEEVRPSQQGPLRVVVVDDNDDIRDTMRQVVEGLGHEVWTGCDGASAVALIKQVRPDLALLDVGLPDFDGMEVARRVRRDSDVAETHLVAITGFGQALDREGALAAGFDEHLVKPASTDDIRRVVSRVGRTARG